MRLKIPNIERRDGIKVMDVYFRTYLSTTVPIDRQVETYSVIVLGAKQV